MKLYHYSASKRESLLTLRTQGVPVEEIKKAEENQKRYSEIGPYVDHISFFLDPIPAAIMGDIYGKDHDVWFNGSTLYEHVIEVSDLSLGFGYAFKETKYRDDFFDAYVAKNGYPRDTLGGLERYCRELNNYLAKIGLIGKDLKTFLKVSKQFIGTLEQNIIDNRKSEDFERGRNLYAANVAHLMLYPVDGIVRVSRCNKITIGSGLRTRA